MRAFRTGICVISAFLGLSLLTSVFSASLATELSAATPPTVTTSPATNITATTTTLNGDLTSKGTATTVNVSFEYGMTVTYGNNTTPTTKTAIGTFSTAVTSLSPATIYHFRARADGGADGTALGLDATFTTASATALPTVITSAATSLTTTSAVLNGELTSMGAQTTVAVSFEWGTNTNYGNTTTPGSRTTTGTFNYSITNLVSGTEYHFRAKADAGVLGAAYSSDALFSALITPPVFLNKWGSSGSGDGQFGLPTGIAVDRAGNIYVAEHNSNRVQKFSNNGAFLTKWGSSGSGDGQFQFPLGIAVDGAGNVYVADQNNRIQKFTRDGEYLTKWGSTGSGDGQFAWPDGIAVDGAGNVYVADTNNNRIQKFSSNGVFLAKWGSTGSGDGQFAWPDGVAVDGTGNVYVSEYLNCRIQKFTGNGEFLTKWGSSGSGDGQFIRPNSVAVDFTGNIYVSDELNHRVQKFSRNGAFLTKWGSPGSGDGQFHSPCEIAVDGAGNVYVTDPGNSRVQVFGIPVNPTVVTSSATFISTNSTTLSGNLTSKGTAQSVNVGFEYGQSTSYGNTVAANTLSSPGAFSAVVTSLTAGSAYHFRAKADGGTSGIGYGADSIFTTFTSGQLIAETSIAADLDTDGAAVIKVNINRVKDVSTGTTGTVPGGIDGYSATASGISLVGSMRGTPGMDFIEIRGVAPYNNPAPTYSTTTGVFGTTGITSPAQSNNSTVAKLVYNLTGNCNTSYSFCIAFQQITAATGGANIPEQGPNSITLRRGDVNGNDTVDIFDAMYIAQYIVGTRPISQLNTLNAASVKHDAMGGDKIDIFDAMYIAQYVVGTKNARFE